MKRWALRILLGLILGAATTVAVAWAAAAWSPAYLDRDRNRYEKAFAESLPGWANVDEEKSLVEKAGEALGAEWWFVYEEQHLQTAFGDGPVMDTAGMVILAGWPASALERRMLREPFFSLKQRDRVSRLIRGTRDGLGVEVFGMQPTQRPTFRPLPYVPLWPGFLINTLFFGGIWLGLFFGVGAMRRGVRRRRGRCPQCGYDLRGQSSEVSNQVEDDVRSSALTSGLRPLTSGAGCPECGWGRQV